MNFFQLFNNRLSTSLLSRMSRRTFSATIYGSILICCFCLKFCGSSQCMLDIYQYETKRTAAIRGQILSKLGLSEPPRNSGPSVIPKEDEERWNQTQRILEEQWLEKLESCHESSSEDGYYAKLTKAYSMESEWPGSSDDETFKQYCSSNRYTYSMFYKFNVSDLRRMSSSITITKAELRIFKANNTKATVDEQHIELFAIDEVQTDKLNSTYHPVRRFLGASVVSTREEEWLTFDVKSTVDSWIHTCDKDLGLELSTHCDPFSPRPKLQLALADSSRRVTVPSKSDNDRGDYHQVETTAQFFIKPGSHPTLIVFYSSTRKGLSGSEEETSTQLYLRSGSSSEEDMDESQSGHSRRRTRRRRAAELDEDFCDYETSKRCCLREFYIDFEKHLNWRWIRRPRGYRANFCAGSCPYMWGTDVMNTQVIGLYKKMNPDASPSPCCVSKKLKPLSILYYEGNKPVFTTLSDMITTSCKCS